MLFRSWRSAAVVAGACAILGLSVFSQNTRPAPSKTFPIPPQKVLDFQHHAVAGDLQMVVKMATEDTSLINSRGREGQTALTQALVSVSPRGRDEALWLL